MDGERVGLGCSGTVVAVGAVVLAIASGLGWLAWQARQEALARAAAEAAGVSEKAAEVLGRDPAAPWDVDRSVRVLLAIDGAMAESTDVSAYVEALARMDLRDVHPGVLDGRKRILDALIRMDALQTQVEAREAAWEGSTEAILQALSVVSVSGEFSLLDPGGAIQVDRAQAARLLEQAREDRAEHDELVDAMTEVEAELLDALSAASGPHHEVLRAWDELSLVRDRAWLALHQGDWDTAIQAAEEAMRRAPREREAHWIAAAARIERDGPEALAVVGPLLQEVLEEHPDAAAPSLLLLGVAQARAGQPELARNNLMAAAVDMPRQAERLSDVLDPYRRRSWLRKSREGGFIVDQVESLMTGAGAFSPDLQLAAIAYAEGQPDVGRAKVLDHFARRRAQGAWPQVLADLKFCEETFGAAWLDVFPEESWLDLEVSSPLVGSGLKLAVRHRGETDLHNATLVLAVHMTDTFPDDWDTIRAGDTLPVLPAGETTSLGTVAIAVPVLGEIRDESAIVSMRAIVVSDEAVSWVDTPPFRAAEVAAARRGDDVESFGPLRTVVDRAGDGVVVAVELGFGKDDLRVDVPRELALVRPMFRLDVGGELIAPTENRLDASGIHLVFGGVADLDDAAARPQVALEVSSALGSVRWGFVPAGLGYRRVQ